MRRNRPARGGWRRVPGCLQDHRRVGLDRVAGREGRSPGSSRRRDRVGASPRTRRASAPTEPPILPCGQLAGGSATMQPCRNSKCPSSGPSGPAHQSSNSSCVAGSRFSAAATRHDGRTLSRASGRRQRLGRGTSRAVRQHPVDHRGPQRLEARRRAPRAGRDPVDVRRNVRRVAVVARRRRGGRPRRRRSPRPRPASASAPRRRWRPRRAGCRTRRAARRPARRRASARDRAAGGPGGASAR